MSFFVNIKNIINEIKRYYGGRVYRKYHENGMLEIECFCRNGIEDGPYKRYYDNGQLNIKCIYKKGVKDGSYEEYCWDGKLAEKRFYRNGLYEKEEKEYYDDGKVKRVFILDENGEKNGPYESY